MTLNYGLFDVSDPENPDRVYSAALLSRIVSKHIRDGIVHGDGGELAVSASDPPAMSVQVGTGTAMVQGRFCENDAAMTLAVPAADTTYARIDRVVVRLNTSPGRVIDILVKKGTPAPSPVPPSLTRTPETWELSLAQIFVAAGATMVQAANITDERGNASLCGVAAPVYVPSSQVEVVGAMNMQGHALTGLPAPSAATDAARKGYVDAEIAGAIGGFGISDIAIDADKDWGGRTISNVVLDGSSKSTLVIARASDTLRASSDAQVFFYSGMTKAKEIQLSSRLYGSDNTFRVKFDLRARYSEYEGHAQIYVNDSPRGTHRSKYGSSFTTFSEDITGLKAGDKIQLYTELGYVANFRIYADYYGVLVPVAPSHTVIL